MQHTLNGHRAMVHLKKHAIISGARFVNFFHIAVKIVPLSFRLGDDEQDLSPNRRRSGHSTITKKSVALSPVLVSRDMSTTFAHHLGWKTKRMNMRL